MSLINPAPAAVLGNPFGPRKSINAGGYKTDGFHDGQDFKNNGQTFPVYAAAAGTVVSIGRPNGTYSGRFVYNGSGGNSVVIQHDGVAGVAATGYAHFASVAVSAGERVSAGQYLGMAGTTGASTGIHLHFVVWPKLPWISFATVEPMQFINGGGAPGAGEEDDMFTEQDRNRLNACYGALYGPKNLGAAQLSWANPDGVKKAQYGMFDVDIETQRIVKELSNQVKALSAQVAALKK